MSFLNKSYTVDLKTGKKQPNQPEMFIMPAKPGTCPECATPHQPEQAHNAQSLYYQYKFYDKNGRWPNWIDAMAHCSVQVKELWTKKLENLNVDVKGGQVNPTKKGEQ